MTIGALAGLAGPAMGLVGEALKMGTELVKMGAQMAKSQSNKGGGGGVGGGKEDGCEKDKIAHEQMHNKNQVNFSNSSSSATNHISISASSCSKAA